MCSQPPKEVDDRWLLDEIEAALELIDRRTRSFTFTGGEPLLEWRKFVGVLERCRLPTTAVHVLTNGRAFARPEIASAWAGVGHPNLMAGIPIYAAVDHVHDYVVQASGAFDETVLGILRLKDAGQRVEIRVVLHAITAPRIVKTCRWIARNLPFVDHVALMGLENTGFALANDTLIWIDPVDYQDDLEAAVDAFAGRVPVSIYNLPRCLLPRPIWPYAVQSISDPAVWSVLAVQDSLPREGQKEAGVFRQFWPQAKLVLICDDRGSVAARYSCRAARGPDHPRHVNALAR